VGLDLVVINLPIRDIPRLKLLHALRNSHLWDGIADPELARLLQLHLDTTLNDIFVAFPPGRVPDHECVDPARRGTVCPPRKAKKKKEDKERDK
jgi:hypothetical protein